MVSIYIRATLILYLTRHAHQNYADTSDVRLGLGFQYIQIKIAVIGKMNHNKQEMYQSDLTTTILYV